MLTLAKRVLAFEMTIAEWIGTGIVLGVPVVMVLAVVTWLLMPSACAG